MFSICHSDLDDIAYEDLATADNQERTSLASYSSGNTTDSEKVCVALCIWTARRVVVSLAPNGRCTLGERVTCGIDCAAGWIAVASDSGSIRR